MRFDEAMQKLIGGAAIQREGWERFTFVYLNALLNVGVVPTLHVSRTPLTEDKAWTASALDMMANDWRTLHTAEAQAAIKAEAEAEAKAEPTPTMRERVEGLYNRVGNVEAVMRDLSQHVTKLQADLNDANRAIGKLQVVTDENSKRDGDGKAFAYSVGFHANGVMATAHPLLKVDASPLGEGVSHDVHFDIGGVHVAVHVCGPLREGG